MGSDQVRSRVGREWFVALTAFSLLIAPFGCELRSGSDDGGGVIDVGGQASNKGLFINEDFASPLLMAARDDADNQLFVFGTRNADGDPEEIESVSIESDEGASFVSFESGRPVHAAGPDGSYVHVDYVEVSSERLTADVELFDASTNEQQTFNVDIDLRQTAQQIVQAIRDVTGFEVKAPEAPGTGKLLTADSVRVTIFSPLYVAFVLPFVALITFMTVVLGQILNAIFTAVAILVQTALLVALSPLFILGELLDDVVLNVRLITISDLFSLIPDPPLIVLV